MMTLLYKTVLTKCLILIYLSLFQTNSHADAISIAVDQAYFPYMYEQQPAQGLYPVIIKKVLDHAAIHHVDIIGLPWKRALKESEKGHLAIGGIYKNRQRLNIYHYSDWLYEEKLVIFVNRWDAFNYTTLSDLKQCKVVGINRGWSYGQDFDTAKQSGIFITEETSNNLSNFKKLSRKRVGCVVADELSAKQAIYQLNLQNQFEQLATPVTVNRAYLAIAKTSDKRAFLRKFNASLKELKTSGHYQQIVDQFIKHIPSTY